MEFAVGPLVPDDDATTKDYIINYRIVDENGDPLPNCEGDGLGGSLHFMTVSDQVGGNQHSGEVGLSCRGAYFALIEVLDANSNFIDRIVINVSGGLQATDAVEAPEPPAKTTGLSATAVSHDTVTLTWDNPQDDSITGYVILRREREIHPVGAFVTITGDTGSADHLHRRYGRAG